MGVIERLPTFDAKALVIVEQNAKRLIATGTAKQKADAEIVTLAIADERLRRRQAVAELGLGRSDQLVIGRTLEIVRQAATAGRFLSYGEVAKHSNVPWNTARRPMPQHLGDLCDYAYHRGWPLLSAIVVNKESLKTGLLEPLSLSGFIKAAESLGFQYTAPLTLLRNQQRQVFEWGKTAIQDLKSPG